MFEMAAMIIRYGKKKKGRTSICRINMTEVKGTRARMRVAFARDNNTKYIQILDTNVAIATQT